MTIPNYIAVILLFYSSGKLVACNNAIDTEKKLEKRKTTIHFKNTKPIEFRAYLTEKAYTYKDMSVQLITMDDFSTINLSSNIRDTTITLNPNSENLILKYAINLYDYSHFLIKSGDSLTISFKNPKPEITIHNRETKAMDYVLDQKEVQSGFSNVSQCFNANFFYVKNKTQNIAASKADSKTQKFIAAEKGVQAIRKQYGELALNDLSQKVKLLESVKENISSFLYEFYNYLYTNEKLSVEVMLNIDSLKYKKDYAKLIINQPDKYLLNNPTDLFYEQFYLSKADVAPFGMGLKRDYKQTFDLVKSSTIFNNQEKDYLFSKLLNWVSEETPSELKEYYNKYVPEIKDQVLAQEIDKRYRLILNPNRSTEHLSLESLEGEITDLDHLISKYKDKVIYIDFWASWCGPCLEEMPRSVKLSQKYKDEVVFMYFSTDDDVQKWENAIRRSEIKTSKNHFLVLNKTTSKYLQSIKFNSIPRYFLIDKKGEIISNNAPRPSDLKLTQTIDQLLKK